MDEGGSIHDSSPSPQSSPAEMLALGAGFVRRQFLVILSVLPLTVGFAIAYLYTTPPLYTAKASLLIDTAKVQVFKQSVLGDSQLNSWVVDSQLEILKSESFALSVIKKLHLDQDPEFVVPHNKGGGSALSLLLHPLSLFHSPAAETEPAMRALAVFEKRLAVGHVPGTYVIEVDFQSLDPSRAARIANAVINAFIEDQVEAKYQTIGTATAWLQGRLNELRTQASAAERAVVEYKTKNNIVESSGGHLMNEQQLVELNSALGKAHADTVAAQARLDRVSQVLSGGDLDPSATEVATVADALHSEVISKFRVQYLELQQREVLLSARVGHDHLAMVNLRNQMREVRRSIFQELQRIGAAYKSDYDIAKARESSLEKTLASTVSGSQTTNQAQIELRQLESAAQSYRALYDNFQQRYTDSVQQQSFPIPEARAFAPALAPSAPSSPKSLRILAIATLGGLGLGVGLAILRELLDRVFRTSRQLESRLGTESVFMLPILKPSDQDTTKRAAKFWLVKQKPQPTPVSKAAVNLPAARIISANRHLLRYVVDTPLSQFAEALRAVKVTADLSGSESGKIIGVTSSLPNEGKSTVSAALAQLCAHSGARVILIDCDLRKRSLSRDLAPSATAGLIDVLTEAASLDEVIWSDPSTKLSFLPAVVRSRLTHASEVLASAAMKRLFARLREKYEYVIVDLSPLAPVVDVRAATHLVDSYLFVVEWGKTKIDVVECALNSARGVYDNLLGVILNKVDFDRIGRYHYGTYYARYGYYTE
jgi:succinoglycan biosynthesis transport protein ExoP